jgi:hypothetical protein
MLMPASWRLGGSTVGVAAALLMINGGEEDEG